MRLHATMSPQEWKDLLNYLSARGVFITAFPETDKDGLFVDFKWAIVEYNGAFYSLNGNLNCCYPFEVTRYIKISPYEKQQNAYPREVYDTDELFEILNESYIQVPLKGTYKQWIFHELHGMKYEGTGLWNLENRLAGGRENNILTNLKSITTTMHTKDYHVLRFHSADGNCFDYETKSRRITG